ncbi:MAG: type II secretion system GspH family protein [Candidatus Omnitrophica bacterium]|nr:type II secretion system GspH family protein [Candidatus Omnitrophota bacterium]
MRKLTKYAGVTLIELLVTMGILVLLVTILYAVFNVSLRGWQKADNMLQVTTAARVALGQMSKEIASAMIKTGSNSYYCVGFDKEDGSGWRTDSIGDEFYFIAPLKPANIEGGSDLCEVGYWLDGKGTSDTSDDTLTRFYVTDRRDEAGSLFDFNFSTPSGRSNSNEFVFNVTGLEFDFFDTNGDLFDNWDSRTAGGAPAKIKIRITVALGKGTSSTNPEFIRKEFSTVVSLPQ